MTAQIVRYGELKPWKTAFIDACAQASDQKDKSTMIGGGEASLCRVCAADIPAGATMPR